jgi:hypothetical protein
VAGYLRAVTTARRVPYDPCPHCDSDLGGKHATTRRRPVFSAQPGTFRWRCPDCEGEWDDAPVRRSRVATVAG